MHVPIILADSTSRDSFSYNWYGASDVNLSNYNSCTRAELAKIKLPFDVKMINTVLDENMLIDSISPTLENKSNILTHSRYYNNCNFKNMLEQTHNRITILNLMCENVDCTSHRKDIDLFYYNIINTLTNCTKRCIPVLKLHKNNYNAGWNEHVSYYYNICTLSLNGGCLITGLIMDHGTI